MAERIVCAHCKTTGVCSNGENGAACAVCANTGGKFHDYSKFPKGLVCSVCDGRGGVEPFSLKLQNRFLPYFAMGFVSILLLFLIYALHLGIPQFDKVVGFAGTLIGSITGYYFGGKHIESSTPGNPQISSKKVAEP
jgi:hypothetical protein